MCKSIYNCIFDKPFTLTLDVVALLVHLKLKFHNLHDEPLTINADLGWAKSIYQELQQDREEWKYIEINVSSLTK